MQERLFGPLGMRHTALPASDDNTIPEPYTHGYGYGSIAVVLSDEVTYSPDLQAAVRQALKPKDFTGLNPSSAAATGASSQPQTIWPPGSRRSFRARC
jgi:D-alanyl-D-alanine carboxypeptidase